MHQPFHSDGPDVASVMKDVREWWKSAIARWVRPGDVTKWTEAEVAATAADFGMTPVEFLNSVGGPSGTDMILESLLLQRLQSLSLNPADIKTLSPLLLAELQHNCQGCQDKERCQDDFAESDNPQGWESYCPNAGTLRSLS